ncbi:hypothetical protein JL475_18440 [Streptomyces sp. M2CJ-2]|uniref:hypothetical protein n=1 Tax=Streptomyces sp. M2CJ-2 TaxID=2803948 RepID=UPI0019262FC3|nr:hypothetical protein [Streptomyces sp. M2CJ-2]MBL3667932.1 hypothetical protein [Streptomyces sp. M2CJ-2]
MARHDAPKKPAVRRALATLAAAGVVLGVGATTAAAESGSPLDLTGAAGQAVGPVAGLQPNPLAGTGVDPLDNGVRTQVADFTPVDSRTVTGPVTQAPSVDDVPVVGRAAGALGG